MERNSEKRWGFLGNFQSDLSLGKWKGGWLINLNGPQLRYVFRFSVGLFGMDPSPVWLEGIFLETVRVVCSGHEMDDWLGGR